MIGGVAAAAKLRALCGILAMTTDDLIRALTADGYVGRKLRMVLLMALPPATALVAILFFTRIGFRDDIDDALRTARFLFKFVAIAPLVEATVP